MYSNIKNHLLIKGYFVAKNDFAAEVTFNNEHVSLYKVLILDIHYLNLNSSGLSTPFLFISNKKCKIVIVCIGVSTPLKNTTPLFLAKPLRLLKSPNCLTPLFPLFLLGREGGGGAHYK